MKSNRRKFLRVAGLSALAVSAAPALSTVAKAADTFRPNDNAAEGKRWGMVIDTRQFEEPEQFQACIDACHKYHNVPENPGKQEVKWIWTEELEHSFPEQVNNFPQEAAEDRKYLLLCNHCENPPCVRACPTQATFKNEQGIVVMDMHRCIGCRFCMVACPFGARSFNFRDPRPFIKELNPEYPTRCKGVVEKCDFCSERLAVGMMPACVEASEGAILFGDLNDPDSEVREALRENFSIRRKPNLGTQPSVYYII